MDICAVIWVILSKRGFNCSTSGIRQVYHFWNCVMNVPSLSQFKNLLPAWCCLVTRFLRVLTPWTEVLLVKASFSYLCLHIILPFTLSPLPLSHILSRISSWPASFGRWKQRLRSRSAGPLVPAPVTRSVKAMFGGSFIYLVLDFSTVNNI